MILFCKRCGWGTDDLSVMICTDCGLALVKNNTYLIPVKNVQTGKIEIHPQAEARRLLGDPLKYIPTSDVKEAFNVLVGGELNGVPTGKKIREKNEALKKKVAGYEHEQRAVRADVERKIAQKQVSGQIIKS